MDIRVEILAKTESQSLNDPDKSNFVVTLKIEVDKEALMFQGQQFLPSLATDEETFGDLYIGQLLDGEIT